MIARNVVLAGLSVLTLSTGAATRAAPPPSDPHGHAAAQRDALGAQDPMAPVYILTSPTTFKGGVNRLASQSEPARDAAGRSLVLSRILTHQLVDVSRQVHERERRCGGYFAFATRARALEFLRKDRTAQAMQAQAITYTIDNAATVDPWLPQVKEANIRETLLHLSTQYPNRYYSNTTGQQSAQWLRSTWIGLAHGRSDISVDYVTCGDCGKQPSIVMTVRGASKPDEIVVVGGHEDSISDSFPNGVMDAPGGDDDASGIAVMTEVIRIALDKGWRPQRTVKFMAYAAEEVGLRGSRSIADQHRATNANVVGVLQLDMTNYNAGTTLSMRLVQDYSNAALQTFVTGLFDKYLAPLGLTRGVSSCGYACSDHASWTSAGYPSAFMEEPTLFPHRHTPDDKIPNIGQTAAVSVNFAKLALAFVGELGKTTPTAPSDFNDDGRADVFWRNLGTGTNEIWRGADSGTKQAVDVNAGHWHAQGIGDFNGDGKADVLWRDLGNGANDVWLAAQSNAHLAVQAEADLAWRVAGVGDFNGDNRADIFWRNTSTGATRYWPSANQALSVNQATMADQNWFVAGVGDFNGDGRDDVFWRNRVTGANEIWRSAMAGQKQAVTTAPPSWRFVAMADFNKDGVDDVFLRDSSGANQIWRSANSATQQAVTAVADAGWQVAQAADFDGDGVADVLWRQGFTGQGEVWKSARSDLKTTLVPMADMNWKVIPMAEIPPRRAFPASR